MEDIIGQKHKNIHWPKSAVKQYGGNGMGRWKKAEFDWIELQHDDKYNRKSIKLPHAI